MDQQQNDLGLTIRSLFAFFQDPLRFFSPPCYCIKSTCEYRFKDDAIIEKIRGQNPAAETTAIRRVIIIC
jgi:hypothetical protein